MKYLVLVSLFMGVVLYAKKAPVRRVPKRVQISKNATRYIVKKGDWLSSIAESYFGNQKDWQLIAQKNPYIKDPNLIYPGDVISFDALSEMRDTASISQDLPTITPFDNNPGSKTKTLEEEPPLVLASPIDVKVRVKHFIMGQEEVLGEISGSPEERRFFLSGDHVYIQARDISKFAIGTKLSIAKMAGGLEDRTVSKSLNLGELVELVGEIEVLEQGEKFVKCEVEAVFGKIEREDKVVTLIPTVRLGEKIKPPSNLLLKVVMGENVGAKMAAEGALIILDKGWASKVAPDQYYRVYADKDPVLDSSKKVEPHFKGEVQIVYSGKTASIGIVVAAQKPLQLGDALVPYQLFSDPKPAPRKEIETIEIN